jgi:Cdc6-like AAA superfamily ATPase
MEAKEKAKELYNKMYAINEDDFISEYVSKATALIAVDEIDLLIQKSTPKDDIYANLSLLEYWQEVKEELLKL